MSNHFRFRGIGDVLEVYLYIETIPRRIFEFLENFSYWEGHEGLLESHATFNGMEYSIVSEEALKEIIHLQEHLVQIQKEKENE